MNLKSAYVHVIADAFTSVLAIIALLGGWWYGWSWLDPVMGLVGAALVAVWARSLLADTGKVLLDREMDHPLVEEIREAIETSPQTRVTDLHVWRVGKQARSLPPSFCKDLPAALLGRTWTLRAPLGAVAQPKGPRVAPWDCCCNT